MFKKSLLALSLVTAFGAMADSSEVSVNGIGVTVDGVSDGSVLVSAQGAVGATVFDLKDIDVTGGTTAAEITFNIGSDKIAAYQSLSKVRVTLEGAAFNAATTLDADILGGNAGDYAFDAGDAKYPATNVLELTYGGDAALLDADNNFTLSGLVITPESVASNSVVNVKVEMISNVGSQVIDSDDNPLVTVKSQIGAFPLSAAVNSASAFGERTDKVIDVREDRMLFVDGTATDTATFYIYNNKTNLLPVNMTDSKLKAVVKGDFTFLDADGDGKIDAGTSVKVGGDNVEFAADFQSFTYEDSALAWAGTGSDVSRNDTFDVVITSDEERVLPVQVFLSDVSFSYTTFAGTAQTYALSNFYTGEWALNGTNVNVPYLPVGYETLSSNLEIANTSNIDAEISVSGFDQNGVKYPVTKLDTVAAGKTVTKVSEADLVAALGLTAGTKLSLDVTVNAPSGVTVYPYYRENDVRVSLPTSQYRPYVCEASGTISTVETASATAVTGTAGGDVANIFGNTSGSVSTTCKKAND